MHALELSKDTQVFYNGDFSGDIIIVQDGKPEVKIPFAYLKAIVAEYVRGERIEELEQATPDQLLEMRKL